MVWWITHFYCWNNSAHDTSSYRYGKCYLVLVMQTSVKPSSQKCCRCFVRVLPVKTIVLDNVRFHHSAQVAQLFPKSGLFQATFPHSLHTIIQPNRECVLKVEECCVSDALQEWRWAAASNCISSWYHHIWRHPCLLSRCNRDLYYCHHSSNLTGLQETPSLCSYLTSLWQTTFKGHGLLYPYHKQINLCLNLWNGQVALLLV